ncbi:iron-containing alcohol dehydrogenase PsrA [Schauerella aestuarii]|uniref:iron-containing alcohol dehydrogenase PsrA n=1 Tax=Schauerella aestuarii TaxID=2511204 RepID=UPI00136967C8|nr:iron-containing alcohol dehydrogenase PsrA [Achromobacter aestuarii]MYZ41806.1 iron-containing alcohol dehydrogenase [Achromobacter aestuarii]
MWQFHNPVAIDAGEGALAHLPARLGNRRAILITFPEARRLGLCERIQNLLGAKLVAIETDVQPNPDVSWLAPLYERLWREHPDVECIVAVGGGSVIDCAKAMLTGTPSGTFDELLACLAGDAAMTRPPRRLRTLIALPTTAGTGSEVTPWATIWDQRNGRKYSLHLPWTWPEAALIDPALMLSLPASVTLASGLDALSHALESLWNVNRNPVSASLAVSAARKVLATLPQLMRDLDNRARRSDIAEAAILAGMAFSNTKTALAHSLSYGLTLEHGVVHGIACSFSLPRVMRMAFGVDRELDALLLTIFDSHDADQAISVLTAFLEDLGVSTDPESYGMAADQWQDQVNAALKGPRGRNFVGMHPALP